MPLARWFVEEPLLLPGESFFISAFQRLDTERYEAMSPIPYSRIVDFADRNHIDEDFIDIFVSLIYSIDVAVLKDKEKKLEEQRKANERQSRRGKASRPMPGKTIRRR